MIYGRYLIDIFQRHISGERGGGWCLVVIVVVVVVMMIVVLVMIDMCLTPMYE